MGQRRTCSREFKLEAVRLVRDRGVSAAQAARDLDIHENVLRNWMRQQAADAKGAFPGHGRMKPEQQEIERLRREVVKLKAERDILKKSRCLLREGVDVKFGFVAKHRGIWPVRWMCEALGVSHGGYYAWLSRAPSDRAVHDGVLEREIRSSFLASDRTYGARRVWRDVLAACLECGRHRIERLMQRHGLRARPRLRRPLRIRGRGRCQLFRRTPSTGPSRRHVRTQSGSPTSRMSGRWRAGCTWPWSSTCSRGGSWGGR